MGVDLTLLPLDHDSADFGFAHSMLGMPRNSALFEVIEKLPAQPVPRLFSTYMASLDNGERGYGNTQQTPYGEPLVCVTMEQLKQCQLTGPVKAYVKACSNTQRVALFWH